MLGFRRVEISALSRNSCGGKTVLNHLALSPSLPACHLLDHGEDYGPVFCFHPERKLFFHNNGNGTFSEVAKEAGVDDPTGRSLSAVWYDFDGDGWPDLYVANDLWGSKLYLNLHNGPFRDITKEAGISDFRGEMGIAIGDWAHDGDPDIFVTHWIYQENALFENLRYMCDSSKDNSALFFGDVAEMVGLGQVSKNSIGWGTSFFDYDNDGKLDLFVVNGSTFQDDKDSRHLISSR